LSQHKWKYCKIAASGDSGASAFRLCRIGVYGGNRYRIAARTMKTSMSHARRRALWVLRRALRAQTPGTARPSVAATLGQLRSSRRPLLFSLLPRMLRTDGRTATALRNRMFYVENDKAATPPITVSRWRWNRTLAASRRIARRRDRER
jgi:hypothetical protein